MVKPKPDISLAKKTGHFNLLTTGIKRHTGLDQEIVLDSQRALSATASFRKPLGYERWSGLSVVRLTGVRALQLATTGASRPSRTEPLLRLLNNFGQKS
jgi:hypothetical protein